LETQGRLIKDYGVRCFVERQFKITADKEAGMKLLLALVCLFLFTACSGPGPGITGNSSGGIIPYPLVASHGGNVRAVAQAMAAEYCTRYRKFAVITSIHREYGDYVGFGCRWNLSRSGP
jgi:hypothetical protein